MWDHRRMAWAIYWIIIGSFVQAHGFSTTVVEEGEDAIIECGLQTKVEEGYLKWEAITNDTTVLLAYDLRDGFSNCDDRIINCTIHANGSIQLDSVGKEDGARYYRCLRGDADGYYYYSDHRLLVLSKEETSSPPSIEAPHRESVSSYNIGKKGVLHGYNAPVCEDDVDGNLPVVCYPPSGVIVDKEYETIQCNCTDSDGQVDSVTFPVTSITHWVHPGWWKASISLLVVTIISISIIVVLIWISPNLCNNLKKSKTNRRYEVNNSNIELTDRVAELSPLTEQLEQKEKQETEMKNKLEEQNEQINNSQRELAEREEEVRNLKDQLEKQETEMKNKLEEQNEKISKIEKELAVKEEKNNGLEDRLQDKQQQISSLEKILADNRAFFQQQWDTVVKQGGTKYQEDDNNSEFDKNSSPSEKETKEKGSPRKGKKRDPERKLTLKGNPFVTPQETPEKNNQNDEDVETDIDDSYTTEDNKNLDEDETDFSKSKGCSDDTGPNVSRAFKEYLIDDDSEYKGFNLAFTCDGTDMRIELRINEGIEGIICQFEFKNGEIIPSYGGKPGEAIGFTKGTQYDLNLGNDKRVLSLFQNSSTQGKECVKKFAQYDFVHIRLLCIYKSDTCSVSILDPLGLIEYS